MPRERKKPILKDFYETSKTNAKAKHKEYLKEQARLKDRKDLDLNISTLHDRANEFIETSFNVSNKYSEGTKSGINPLK